MDALTASNRNKKINMIFQPHRYSRSSLLFDDFIKSLSSLDLVILMDIYSAGEQNLKGISAYDFVDALRKKGTKALFAKNLKEISSILESEVKDGDILVTQGAGNVVDISNSLKLYINENVIVLFGGDSDEKEISKLSADSIINNIDTTKFDAQLLDLNNLNLKEVDKDTVFFIAVHGFGGEDGQVQDLLSKNGYRFTGSDHESTKKCWDKVLSKEILIQNNINTPKFITIDKNENLNLNDEFFSEITEYFVKPAKMGLVLVFQE